MQAGRTTPLSCRLTADRPAFDVMAALLCHGVFQRFPNLRVASIEMGADWLPYLLRKLERSYGQMPQAYTEHPVETFRRHVWVSPFQEDHVKTLGDLVGAENLLMGSDFPHAEGIAEPSEYVRDLEGFSPAEIRMIMRENALALSQPSKGPTL